MGNSESSPTTPGSSSGRSKGERETSQSRSEGRNNNGSSARRIAPRTYTPPGPHAPQAGLASTSTSTEHAQATISASPAASSSSHARNRSTTAASAPLTRPTDNMGNAESKARPPSRSSTLPAAGVTNEKEEIPQPPPTSQPVDVPHPSAHDGFDGNEKDDLTPAEETAPFGLPASVFNRPPRLPLPIERDPEQGSPLITPQGTEPPPLQNSPLLFNSEPDGDLPKRASLLSSTTLDDDDGADIQQFTMETDPLAPRVNTTLTWKGEGKAVYVTGTFASYDKKFRMHRGADGVFTCTIPLTEGTHHITFLVDGHANTSRDLPTTVDFANALVNYIEVVPPQSPTGDKAAQQQPSEPIPIRAGAGAGRADAEAPDARSAETVKAQPPNNQTPQDARSSSRPTTSQQQQPSQPTPSTQQQQAKPKPKPAPPRPKYTSSIPEVLLHLDLFSQPEDSRYLRAQKATEHVPAPPTLPMFMSKSILNATTPQKDDASVLTMPNHTVLNHLATSSIRYGVLATSGTTRYKRKFLTTIMYKPTHETSD